MRRIRGQWGAALRCTSIAVVGPFAATAAPVAAALSMKACQLITAQDVQGVLGAGYAAQKMTENPIMSVCGYKKGADNGVLVSLQQTIYDSAQYPEHRADGHQARASSSREAR